MAHGEKTLESRQLYDGKVIRLTLDTVALENGETGLREVVHHHGGACVLALTERDELYMVRQFRYAFGRELWELPAGKLEAGEDPLAAAYRELEEECGVRAEKLVHFMDVYPTVGYCTEIIYLYLAEGLRPARQHLSFSSPAPA